MPQTHVATFAFSVEAVVLMGRTAHGDLFTRPIPRGTAPLPPAMLDRLGIAELAERPYTMISGGERQLVLLARALAQEPRFVVLDEPTANLDFGNQGTVMREIRAAGGMFRSRRALHHPRSQPRICAPPTVRNLLSGGEHRLAEGPVDRILTTDLLQELYGAPVRTISDGFRQERLRSGLARNIWQHERTIALDHQVENSIPRRPIFAEPNSYIEQ